MRDLAGLVSKYSNVLLTLNFDLQDCVKKEIIQQLKDEETFLFFGYLNLPSDIILSSKFNNELNYLQEIHQLKSEFGEVYSLISSSEKDLDAYFKGILNPIELFLKLQVVQTLCFRDLKIINTIKWKEFDYDDVTREQYYELLSKLPSGFEHGIELVVNEKLSYLEQTKITLEHIEVIKEKYQPKTKTQQQINWNDFDIDTDFRKSNSRQRFIFLNELGILEILKKEFTDHHEILNQKRFAQALEYITGVGQLSNVQGYYSYNDNPKKNPYLASDYKESKNVQKVKNIIKDLKL